MYMSFYYFEINFFCIIVLLLLLHYLKNNNINITSERIFKCLLITAIVLCFSDLTAGVVRGKMFFGAKLLVEVSNMIYYEAISVLGYLWMLYVFLKTDKKVLYNKKVILLFMIPLIFISILILTNKWTHFLFYIDSNNLYSRRDGIYLHWIISYGYIIVSTIKVIIEIFKEKNSLIKKEMTSLGLFIIAPAIAAIIQSLFYGISLVQFGFTCSCLNMLLNGLKNQISKDELTKLNNRRELNRYLIKILDDMENDDQISILMIDANHFKQINDKYGHVVGDQALIDISNALSIACSNQKLNFFVSRYGGDEFVIIGKNIETNKIDELKNEINKELDIINNTNNNPYVLEVSIGCYTTKKENISSISKLIEQADKEMYKNKKYYKKH